MLPSGQTGTGRFATGRKWAWAKWHSVLQSGRHVYVAEQQFTLSAYRLSGNYFTTSSFPSPVRGRGGGWKAVGGGEGEAGGAGGRG